MTYSVIWLSEAMTAYRRLRAADPNGAKRIAKAVAMLAADPRPAESSSLGGRATVGYASIVTACSMRSQMRRSA
jgi:hypothetical protein